MSRKIAEMVLSAGGYENIRELGSPREVLELIDHYPPDLILLDVVMPHMSGIDLLTELTRRFDLRELPVLVITSIDDPETKRKAFELGARDFVTKPFDTYELVARVDNILHTKFDQKRIKYENELLSKKVAERTEQLKKSNIGLIKSLGRAAELKDNDTGQHVMRVSLYSAIIADGFNLSQEQVNFILHASPMHDIGKIGIPDGILLKPGKLSDNEYEIMKTHCQIGAEIFLASDTEYEHGVSVQTTYSYIQKKEPDLMRYAAMIALTHHEKWDGTGYPLGLKGEEIPIEGRIVAVADVFDALNTVRPYKEKYSLDRCFEIIKNLHGTHFDPQIVDEFCNFIDLLFEIQTMYSD